MANTPAKPRRVESPHVKVLVGAWTDGGTVRVELRSVTADIPLGEIAWEPKWRQYAFTPAQGARYTVKVLRAISRQLDICMRSWERQNAKEGQ